MSLHQLVQPLHSRPLHGSVEFWRQKAKALGGHVEVDFERKRDGLSFRPARLTVYIVDRDGNRVERSPEPWDEEINEDLIAIGTRAVTVNNEVERLGYSLKFKFEPVEVRYGDGFFNAMLVLMLNELGFVVLPSVARCLEKISADSPSRDSIAYGAARRDIENALREAGGPLTASLGYADDVAQQLLGDAVAYYLDERFHITNRERLGYAHQKTHPKSAESTTSGVDHQVDLPDKRSQDQLRASTISVSDDATLDDWGLEPGNTLMLLPGSVDEDGVPHFALSTRIIAKRLSASKVVWSYSHDVESARFYQARDADWLGPTLFVTYAVLVAQPHILTSTLSLISAFLEERFSPDCTRTRVKMSVIAYKTTWGRKVRHIHFDGPPQELHRIADDVAHILTGTHDD